MDALPLLSPEMMTAPKTGTPAQTSPQTGHQFHSFLASASRDQQAENRQSNAAKEARTTQQKTQQKTRHRDDKPEKVQDKQPDDQDQNQVGLKEKSENESTPAQDVPPAKERDVSAQDTAAQEIGAATLTAEQTPGDEQQIDPNEEETGRTTISFRSSQELWFLLQIKQQQGNAQAAPLTPAQQKLFEQTASNGTLTTRFLETLASQTASGINTPAQATAQNGQTDPAGQTGQTQQAGTASMVSYHSTTITIEHWSATYVSHQTTAASSQQQVPAMTNLVQLEQDDLDQPQPAVADTASSLIHVFKTIDGEEGAGLVKNPGNENQPTAGQRFDVTSQYIHSKLPTSLDESNLNQQQDKSADDNARQQASAKDHLFAQQPSGSEKPVDPASLFTMQPLTTPATDTASSASVPGSVAGFRYLPGSPFMDNHILNQVTDRLLHQQRLESGTISLRLHPEQLGNLKLEIKVEHDSIRAHIVAANPQIQDILQRNIPRLREALMGQGLNLDYAEVTVATNGKDNNPQLSQEQHSNRYLRRPVKGIQARASLSPVPEFSHPGKTLEQKLEQKNLNLLV